MSLPTIQLDVSKSTVSPAPVPPITSPLASSSPEGSLSLSLDESCSFVDHLTRAVGAGLALAATTVVPGMMRRAAVPKARLSAKASDQQATNVAVAIPVALAAIQTLESAGTELPLLARTRTDLPGSFDPAGVQITGQPSQETLAVKDGSGSDAQAANLEPQSTSVDTEFWNAPVTEQSADEGSGAGPAKVRHATEGVERPILAEARSATASRLVKGLAGTMTVTGPRGVQGISRSFGSAGAQITGQPSQETLAVKDGSSSDAQAVNLEPQLTSVDTELWSPPMTEQSAGEDGAGPAKLRHATEGAERSMLGEAQSAASSKLIEGLAGTMTATRPSGVQDPGHSLPATKSAVQPGTPIEPSSPGANSRSGSDKGSGRQSDLSSHAAGVSNTSSSRDSSSVVSRLDDFTVALSGARWVNEIAGNRTANPAQPVVASDQPALRGNPAAQERALAAWANMDIRGGQIVNSVALAAQPGHVEMRMDVRTEALGALAIHAVLESGRLGASINAETPEARNVLAAHLPALEQSLSERNVHVEHILISNELAGDQTGQGGSSHSYSENHPGTPPKGTQFWSRDSAVPSDSAVGTENYYPEEGPWRRLSVRA